jgi:hypothetical protein
MFCLLPLPAFQHRAIRLSASATGAFGLVLTIALLSRVDPWANVWERLWVADDSTWGSTKEKGLSAIWCLFLALGVGTDWQLKRRFGENPDEVRGSVINYFCNISRIAELQKWDHYLANYAANLPNASDRAGTFRPLSYSFWNRFFGRQKAAEPLLTNDIVFPREDDLKSRNLQSIASPFSKMYDTKPQSVTSLSQSQPFNLYKGPGYLKKQGRLSTEGRLQTRTGKRKEKVKFGEAYSDASSDSDSDGDLRKSPLTPSDNIRPWLKDSRSVSSNLSGSTTLNGGEESGGGGKKGIKDNGSHDAPEYSDYEEDVTAHVARVKRRVSRDQPGWSPDFMKRHVSQNTPSSNSSSHQTPMSSTPRAVPATPSLIRAIDRVALAQQEAFTLGQASKSSDGSSVKGLPNIKEEQVKFKGARWDDFWRDVKAKAGQR